MAKKIPVISWIPRQAPSKDPKFHMVERLGGAGKSIRALLIALKIGWVWRIGDA